MTLKFMEGGWLEPGAGEGSVAPHPLCRSAPPIIHFIHARDRYVTKRAVHRTVARTDTACLGDTICPAGTDPMLAIAREGAQCTEGDPEYLGVYNECYKVPPRGPPGS
jgi:hypothetical protein